jgi:hypothetical protein
MVRRVGRVCMMRRVGRVCSPVYDNKGWQTAREGGCCLLASYALHVTNAVWDCHSSKSACVEYALSALRRRVQ